MLTTDTALRKAKPQPKEYFIQADHKLFLRIRPDGKKAWIFRYQAPDGKAKKLSLGHYPDVTLAQAAEEAARLRGQLSLGRDPQLDRQAAREAHRKAAAGSVTVREAFGTEDADGGLPGRRTGYYKTLGRLKSKGVDTLAIFEANVFPVIGHLPIRDVRKSDVLRCIHPIVERGSLRMANRVLTEIKGFFNGIIAASDDEDWINPAATIPRTMAGGHEVEAARTRYLSIAELHELRKRLGMVDPMQLPERSQVMIWLLLTTGNRVEETALAKWEHIDFDQRIWHLPAENRKKIRGQPPKDHKVYLSDFAIRLLTRLQQLAEGSPWVTPAAKGGQNSHKKRLTAQVYYRQQTAKRSHKTSMLLTLPGGRWTPHDLRRTFATLAGELGVHREVIELCLSHSKSGIEAVYQHQVRWQDQVDAWCRVGVRLEQIFEG